MQTGQLVRIVNEYADVEVRVVPTGCGTRLEIRSLRGGERVLLDATNLEAIASLDDVSLATLVTAFTELGTAAQGVVGGGADADG
jgi:hypothetical protein